MRVDVHLLTPDLRARARGSTCCGHLLLLFPFTGFAGLGVRCPRWRASWRVREGSPDPGGLPRYPLKAVMPRRPRAAAAAGRLAGDQGRVALARRAAGQAGSAVGTGGGVSRRRSDEP